MRTRKLPCPCFNLRNVGYIFDRELRLLVLDAIERIEVSVRSQWAYQLAHLHGSHAHLDPTLFNPRFWQKNIDDLTREVKRSDELFIQHFQTSYVEPLPPVWAVCEVMSLGLLSRWYGSLRFTKTQTAIAWWDLVLRFTFISSGLKIVISKKEKVLATD
jgi:abortive infection bacteriophage resistance protein